MIIIVLLLTLYLLMIINHHHWHLIYARWNPAAPTVPPLENVASAHATSTSQENPLPVIP